MERIRWGIIGPGRIAHKFAKDIEFAPSAHLCAVASRDQTRAQAFADQYGGLAVAANYEALCARPDIDAIYIATPHTQHMDHSLLAINAGKAVLCEKPLTINPKQSRALCKSADESGVYLMEAMWTWFLPAIAKAKAWVDEGRIGEIVHIKADFGSSFAYDPNSRVWNTELAGGCLLDMGIYPVAFDYLFAGQVPEKLSVVSRFAPNGVDKDLSIVIDHGKITSMLATSFVSRLPNAGYIIGTQGYIAVPDFIGAKEAHLFKNDDCLEQFYDDRAGAGFEFQIEAVSQDIIAGRTQSKTISHMTSQAFQDSMAAIRAQF